MLSKRHLFADMTPSKAATEPGSQTNLHEIKKEKKRLLINLLGFHNKFVYVFANDMRSTR